MKPGGVPLRKEGRFLFNRLPFYLIFYPTSRCNARCRHCFNHKRQEAAETGEELTLEEIARISGNFGHIKVLTLTGGEPFLRKDLAEIAAIFHKNNGVQYVSFHTNAFFTEEVIRTVSAVLERLPGIQVMVCVSIDGIGQAHDDCRGLAGSFKKAMETLAGLKTLKEKHGNLSLIVNTVLSRTTSGSFTETMRFIETNIPYARPTLSLIRGLAREEGERLVDCSAYEAFHKSYCPGPGRSAGPFSAAAVRETVEMLTNKIVAKNYRSRRQAVACQAGRKLAVIYENGDVYPCEMLADKLGNLRDAGYDIKKLLFSPKARGVMEKIRRGRSCYCTWENIIPVNLLFSPRHYPVIFYTWLRRYLLSRK